MKLLIQLKHYKIGHTEVQFKSQIINCLYRYLKHEAKCYVSDIWHHNQHTFNLACNVYETQQSSYTLAAFYTDTLKDH